MLRFVALAPQALLALLVVYNLIVALWGWKNPAATPPGRRDRRIRVVIPAHNEEGVIGNVIDDLGAQTYRAGLVDVWVVADRCTDRTVAVATPRVSVAERREGPDGKGAALAWYLADHPLAPDEILVIVDADNRLPVDFLSRIADEVDAGAAVVQAYLDVSNPDASLLATASAVSYWASNRMVQLARHNLGWAVDLGGTGMAVLGRPLEEAGGFGPSLTEDQDLTVRLLLAGHPVRWMHDVRIGDEKPSSLGVALRQRARWASGKQAVGRVGVGALLRSRVPGARDLVLRIIQPSRTFAALLSGLLAVMALLFPGDYLLAWQFWVVLAAVQFLIPLPFLMRDGVPGRYLWRYPLLAVFGILYLPVRLLGRWTRGWYHTPHEGE